MEEIRSTRELEAQNQAKIKRIETLQFLYEIFAIVKCEPEQVQSDLRSRLEQSMQGINWNVPASNDVESEFYNPEFDDDLPDFGAMNKLKSKLRGDEM